MNVALLSVAFIFFFRWEYSLKVPKSADRLLIFLMILILAINYELIWRRTEENLELHPNSAIIGALYLLMMIPVLFVRLKTDQIIMYLLITIYFIQIGVHLEFGFLDFFLFLPLPLPVVLCSLFNSQ